MTNTARTLTPITAMAVPTSQLFDMMLDATVAWSEAPALRQPLDAPENTIRFAKLELIRIIQDELTRRIDSSPDDL